MNEKFQTTNEYAKYLFNANKIKGANSLEFIIKSSNLLNRYKDNKFWELPDKEAFNFLLKEIIDNNFDIKDILYVLSEKKIVSGFNEYILEYIASKNTNAKIEKEKLEKLAKLKRIDALIIELIKQEFYIEKENENMQKQK